MLNYAVKHFYYFNSECLDCMLSHYTGLYDLIGIKIMENCIYAYVHACTHIHATPVLCKGNRCA